MSNTISNIRNKYQLDDFQIKSFDYIDKKINQIVCAPTGSGKTTIADYAIEQVKQTNPNAKIIYTCPIKALCNEKYRDMVLFWGNEPYNYVIGLMTGDIIINPYGDKLESDSMIKQKNGDIVVMTTEVLQKLMESQNTIKFNPDVIIFDEAHYINDDSRGHVWEKCIIGSLLNTNALLIMLSATIGNIEEIKNWLNTICPTKKTEIVIKTDRPVPLRQFVIDTTKSRIFKNKSSKNDEDKFLSDKVTSDPDPESYELLELNNFNYDKVKKYWSNLEEFGYSEKFELETICNQISSNQNLGIPAIIFVLSKKKCEEYAQLIENTYFINFEEKNEILKFFDSNLKEFNTCLQYIELRKVISKGIGYHHSGLIPKIREVVEFLIKNKLIKIVFATETFAVGLNFPVKTVVITNLTKPTEKGFRFLTVSEYKQMAGRAGRRFLDPFGNVVIMLFNSKPKNKFSYPTWNQVNEIVNGPINNIMSKYIIEPNYILKNITSDLAKQMSLKSFKYYKSVLKIKDLKCNIKFEKLFDIDKKTKEFANLGITFKDKSYSKLYSKLSKEEQKEYNNFIIEFNKESIKTDLELHLELESSIIDFLLINNFICKNQFGFIYTPKGVLACEFNEINPIIFTDHLEHIMEKSNNIIPILSMFIDDGIKISDEEIILWDEIELEIVYWENEIKSYSKFINKFPKWTFWPKNYIIIKEWINNPSISLDEIVSNHNTDCGLFIKILIKMYQITDEIINKLDKLNLTDLTNKLIQQKELLIRYPLKIDSLYINL